MITISQHHVFIITAAHHKFTHRQPFDHHQSLATPSLSPSNIFYHQHHRSFTLQCSIIHQIIKTEKILRCGLVRSTRAHGFGSIRQESGSFWSFRSWPTQAHLVRMNLGGFGLCLVAERGSFWGGKVVVQGGWLRGRVVARLVAGMAWHWDG